MSMWKVAILIQECDSSQLKTLKEVGAGEVEQETGRDSKIRRENRLPVQHADHVSHGD